MQIIKSKIFKRWTLLLTSFYIMSVNLILSYASETDLENTKLVSGTKSLLSVGTAVLTSFVLVLTIFVAVKDAITWQSADLNEKPAAKKRLITEVGIGILGICIGGVITAIFSFYQ